MERTRGADASRAARLPGDVVRAVDDCLEELDGRDFSRRLWAGDASLWPGDAGESSKRLGWLRVTQTMPAGMEALRTLSAEMGDGSIRDVVLLGMGGSSLGAEVLNQVFGPAAGYPHLHVLDSTVPSAVKAVADGIDIARTLLIVSSKSGGTMEPNLLYDFFAGEMAAGTGAKPGSQSIAITDAGTSLERLARDSGFRHLFLNPPDIGGRYSVLSLFGLVPCAVLGLDPARLLGRAADMARSCGPGAATRGNPGAWLGAYLAACVRLGRDKLTFITSPALQSFGLWAEQLIAESTGKGGKGIVPVVGEPEFSPPEYSADRAFVFLRFSGDGNDEADRRVAALAESGLPCLTIAIEDAFDLGSEFFRWEYATAAAGALLNVNPFDQPDVQSAKDASQRVLAHFVTHGALPDAETTATPSTLAGRLRPGGYLAVMAYLRQRPDTDSAFARFRRTLGSSHRVATTLGYGPRFLHSTGQLHKGGPNEGVFLQVVSDHPDDVPVPRRGYTFGIVADAQALGDLQALCAQDRPVARIVLQDDNPALLEPALQAVQ